MTGSIGAFAGREIEMQEGCASLVVIDPAGKRRSSKKEDG
jgi:hypothetical protein